MDIPSPGKSSRPPPSRDGRFPGWNCITRMQQSLWKHHCLFWALFWARWHKLNCGGFKENFPLLPCCAQQCPTSTAGKRDERSKMRGKKTCSEIFNEVLLVSGWSFREQGREIPRNYNKNPPLQTGSNLVFKVTTGCSFCDVKE